MVGNDPEGMGTTVQSVPLVVTTIASATSTLSVGSMSRHPRAMIRPSPTDSIRKRSTKPVSISVHCRTGPVDSSSGVGSSGFGVWSSSTLDSSSTVPVSSGSASVCGPPASPLGAAEEAVAPLPSAAAVSGPSGVAAFCVGIFCGDNDRARAVAAESVPGHDTSDDQHRRGGDAGQRAHGRLGPWPGPRPAPRSARPVAVPTPSRIARAGPDPRPAPQLQIVGGTRLVGVRAGAGRGAGFIPLVGDGVFSIVAHGWITLRQVGETPRHQALHRARPHTTHRLGGLPLGHLLIEAQHYRRSLPGGQRVEGVDQVVAFWRCFRRGGL